MGKLILVSKKHKLFIIIFLILFFSFFVGRFFYSSWLQERELFYPDFHSSHSLAIQQLSRFFHNEKYMTVTTYVDDIFPSLKESDQLIAVFYQAESYFLLKQYGMAWKKFFTLYENYPKMWQVSLRLAAIQIINHNLSPALDLLKGIHTNAYEYFYWKGRYYEANHQYSLAIQQYLKANLQLMDVNYRIGLNYYQLNAFHLAKKYLLKMFDVNHENYQKNQEMLFDIAYRERSQEDMLRFEKSLQVFYKTNLELVAEVSQKFYEIGDKENSLRVYSFLNTEKNLTAKTALTLFDLNYDLKQYSQAILFGELFSLDQERQIQLANAYLIKKRYMKAIMKCRKILNSPSLNEKNKQATQKILFDAYLLTQNNGKALTLFQQIQFTHLDPEMLKKGITVYSAVQPRYKKEYLNLLNTTYHQDPSMLKDIITDLQKHFYYEEALQFLKPLLQKKDFNVEALYYQAMLYADIHELNHAQESLSKLLNIPMKDGLKNIYFESMFSLGSILLSQDQFANAAYWFEKAIQIKNTHKLALRLAFTYFSLHQWKLSVHYLKTIQETSDFSQAEEQLYHFLIQKQDQNAQLKDLSHQSLS